MSKILPTSLLSFVICFYGMCAVRAQDNCPDFECLCGDVNLDEVVNMADADAWRELIEFGGPYQCEADGNYDGVVNLLDLSPFRFILLEHQSESFEDATTAGPADFFWSTKTLGEGAVNQDLDLTLSVGDTETLYLYYTINGPSASEVTNGISINVATTNSGIIKFDEAGTFNFPIEIFDIAIQQRWGYPTAGGYFEDIVFQSAFSIQDDSVIGMTAMRIASGSGIVAANDGGNIDLPLLDSGYDSCADAFQFGKAIVTATAPGPVSLVAGPNNLGIANNGQVFIPQFANAQINVVANVLLGDVNLDGEVNLLDIGVFVDRIASGAFQIEADCNEDGDVNLLDVVPFVQILTTG